MKKVLSILGALLVSSSSIAANLSNDNTSGLEVKLDGTFDFRSAFRNQSVLKGEEENLSAYRKNFAFTTSAAIYLGVTQNLEDISYGARVTLLPSTKASGSPSYNGSHIFIESNYGKVELGSTHDAGSKMRITGYKVAAATGDGWSGIANLCGREMKFNNMLPEFESTNNYFLDGVYSANLDQVNDSTEQSRKISYFTPKFQGFQVGISYIPDSSNLGVTKFKKAGFTSKPIQITDLTFVKLNQNVKDAFSLGLAYEHNIEDGFDIKIAATGEYGKPVEKIYFVQKVNAKDDVKKANVVDTANLSPLRTYNIGAALNYGNVASSVSYGNLGKSLTNAKYHKSGRDTHYYNAAIAYKIGPVNTSISYFTSSKYKNTVNAVTLGTDYKMLPGVVPYAEVTYFNAAGKPAFYPEADKKKIKGTVALIGAKIKF